MPEISTLCMPSTATRAASTTAATAARAVVDTGSPADAGYAVEAPETIAPPGKTGSDAAAALPRLTVYFDGACPVCSREIATYRRLPGASDCAWIDATRCDADAFGPGLGRDDALGRMTVRRADGSLARGAAAFAEMWLALPSTRLLGRMASFRPVTALLDLAYTGFLRLRPLWRPREQPWPRALTAELRSDHAGELGAVFIYRGVLAFARDPALRRFAEAHGATEQRHLDLIEAALPPAHRSRLLPAWRLAGWLTGALPALCGPRAVYATIAAVETFVDTHYAQQLDLIDRLAPTPRLDELRALLAACRDDELHHRDEALACDPATGRLARLWAACVGRGSAAAVVLARRV